jgi:hypothetical protein
VFFNGKQTNSHESRVGTGTTGPGEAVFAIGAMKVKEIVSDRVKHIRFEKFKK